MGSWLSDLEQRKKEEEKRKQQQEQAENFHRQKESVRGLRLKELSEKQYRKQIDSICECVKELLSRAKAAGVIDLQGGAGVYATTDASGYASLHLATIERWSDRIEAFLEEGGQIKVSYRWRVKGVFGEKSREQTLPIQAVTESIIEGWIEWVVSEKSEDLFSRMWRRLRDGG